MADRRSLEMTAFKYAIGTSANKRLAQGFDGFVSAVSSFMFKYLDPVVKVDQCEYWLDGFVFEANNPTDLNQNIRAVS